MELLQLIREAKCLDRMGVEIPESAKIVLFQEEKLKSYYNDLHWALNEYDRIVTMVRASLRPSYPPPSPAEARGDFNAESSGGLGVLAPSCARDVGSRQVLQAKEVRRFAWHGTMTFSYTTVCG